MDNRTGGCLNTPNGNGNGKTPEDNRFAYYSLGLQAVISIIVLVASFYLIYTPTEAVVNQTAGNLITFVLGVWLGRGVDYGVSRARG